MILPQELLNAIVQGIDDPSTLKSCSLAGSSLREESQRILLHSLTLGVESHAAKSAILDESPHIATYIVDLTVYIPNPDEIVDLELTGADIQSILRRLQNVRRCVFDVPESSPSCVYWPELPHAFSSTYLHFLSRQQSLRELRIANVFELPLDVILSLLTAAPTLILNRVGVVQDLRDSELSLHHLPSLRRLILEPGCPRVCLCGLFARRQYSPLTSGLTYLEIQASDHTVQENISIIANAAETLHSLRIETERDVLSVLSVNGRQLITCPLPSLPALLSLEYVLPLSALTAPWFLDAILEVLAPESNPKLTDLTLVFRYSNPTMRGFPSAIKVNAMSMLDAALAAHPASPCLKVRWNVDMERFNVVFDYAQHFHKFVRMVQQAMPSAQVRGKLVVERVPLNVD
ncbi:hypothetical protein MSAN_02019000 [Mycena sanguinolenta]|uniref:Uncharacterized protein n=1 Tax=Mycena sanguinolenta TaxID=230812 RepID=A0A8H6XLG2_9AGAR|nr:hypothetical protein MSAN_02019000 [Mycena sanguinolenta]